MKKLTLEVQKVLKVVTFKNVQTFRAREGYGFNAKIYISKELIGEYRDAGNGGCTDFIEATKGSKQKLIDLLSKHNFKQLMIDSGWTTPDDDSMIDVLTEEYGVLIESIKTIKARGKKNIVFGVPFGIGYREVGWKAPWTLEKIVAKDKTLLENLVEKIAKQLVGDEKILNVNLNEFNLTLSEFAKSKLAQ